MIEGINKAFESRVRLGIMSALMVNDWLDFNAMKSLLDVTDGNLSSHISALEKLKFIDVRKEFVGKRPKTSYRVTPLGKRSFSDHLNALEKLLNGLT
ncbi:MAG: transcriptional regulator [Flavobacteriales bacterium]|nr:transcriptional regulator [Bacteroidota bacterium]MCB9239809.1 transcriptional regulator [Flavobacteriales bacterium]